MRNGKKIALPKEIAELLTKKKEELGLEEAVFRTIYNADGPKDKDTEVLAGYFTPRMFALMAALVNGYIALPSKEESELADYYARIVGDMKFAQDCPKDKQDYESSMDVARYLHGKSDGIRKAVDILRIKIDGINDKEVLR